MKEIHPQVSVSFIKCDRNSIGTSEKVDPIWRKDAWNGGMVEYPKTQNGGKRLHIEVSIVAVKMLPENCSERQKVLEVARTKNSFSKCQKFLKSCRAQSEQAYVYVTLHRLTFGKPS